MDKDTWAGPTPQLPNRNGIKKGEILDIELEVRTDLEENNLSKK